MAYWLISPRDPLIFRNGKPFTASPGSRAETLPIPFPSTLAGAVRTMAGRDPTTGKFRESLINSLLLEEVHGPFFVELDGDDNVVDYLFPAPADALLIKIKEEPEKAELYDLKPLSVSNAWVDLKNFKICGPLKAIQDKPFQPVPTFWKMEKFVNWLEKHEEEEKIVVSDIGICGLIEESRSHVSIETSTQIAEDGALFQTTGLEFSLLVRNEGESYPLSQVKRFGFLVNTDAEFNEGVYHLGGERRITRWKEKPDLILPFGTCPESIKNQILNDGYCRLILVTPAYFKAGNVPTNLLEFGVSIEAVVNKRYQSVSGWDYDKNSPKPSRRLTPAGSVYFLKLPEDKEKRTTFIDSVWLNAISDDDQFQRDGFGIALLGVWDGIDRQMIVEV